MIETKVTYTLERDGHFYLVENVPARISPETGEQFFFTGNRAATAVFHFPRMRSPKK
jgi:hypothetical protein